MSIVILIEVSLNLNSKFRFRSRNVLSLLRRSNHEGVNKIRLFRRDRLVNKHGVLSISVLKLRASRSRFSSSYSLAVAMQASAATVSTMRLVVAGASMAKQAHMLARIYTKCLAQPPLFAGIRTCFDETSHEVVAGSNQRGEGDKGP